MTEKNLDSHTVAHDASSIAVAAVGGLATGLAEGSTAIGLVAGAAVAAAGIGAMKVGPIRRTVNRAINAVEERTK